MKASVEQGLTVRLTEIETVIDGLRVKKVGRTTWPSCATSSTTIMTVPDEEIFDAMLRTMAHTKVVVEGAAAAPVAAVRQGLVQAPEGGHLVCVLSGGNVDLTQLRGLRWN